MSGIFTLLVEEMVFFVPGVVSFLGDTEFSKHIIECAFDSGSLVGRDSVFDKAIGQPPIIHSGDIWHTFSKLFACHVAHYMHNGAFKRVLVHNRKELCKTHMRVATQCTCESHKPCG